MRSPGRRFIKPEILQAASTTLSLMKIDLEDNTMQLIVGKVDLGNIVKYELKILKTSHKATELQVLNFKKSAVQF